VAPKNYQGKGRLKADEKVILDLVRLGFQGDTNSIRQFARKLLRPRSTDKRSARFRTELGTLLVDGPSSPLRAVAARPIPVEPESGMALAMTEEVPDEERPILDEASDEALTRLIGARRGAAALWDAGVDPPKTVLLTGSPGVGKTMTARFMASTLGLPLVNVELAALMSSLLGKTGQNLRRIFDHAREAPCVLLLDEFDAVAKRRDDSTDIGELKRLVNLLLLELERWPAAGLLVAATNHPQLLDPAVERRFDVCIELGQPGVDERQKILERAISRVKHEEDPSPAVVAACALALEGASGADLERAVSEAARIAVLEDRSFETAIGDIAMRPLRADSSSPERRAAFASLASKQLKMSQREIALHLGVTHPTVGKLIRLWEKTTNDKTAQGAVAEGGG
jgi:SpoVK/Ycf46/Vps4 family AAA+-type ATPase